MSESGQEIETQAAGTMPESDEPDLSDWLQSLETEETGAQGEELVAEELASPEVPSWLAGLEDKEEGRSARERAGNAGCCCG